MDPKEFEALLDDAENRLERLRVLYEQWFQGFERLEPAVPRKEVERRMQRLRREKPRNTALRFRFQTLWQRYTTFQTYWGRVSRQIEEGTYRRDLMKARARRKARQDEFSGRRKPAEVDIEVDLDELDADKEVEAALAALQPDAGTAPETEAAAAADAADGASAARPTPGPAPRAPAAPPAARSAPPQRGSISPFAMSPSKRPAAQQPDGGPVTATFGKPKDPLSGVSAKPAHAKQTPAAAQRTPTPTGQRRAPGAGQRPPTPTGQRRTPGAGQRPPAPGQRPAASSAGDSIEEARMKRIYQQYVQARKRNNERTDNVNYEGLKRSVDKMVPKLREKHKGKNIDFEVVVRNGKVGLKPKSE